MWTLDRSAQIPCWRATHAPGGALLAFTTRRGGTSAAPFDTMNLGRSTTDLQECITENRSRLLTSLGAQPASLATAGQVHGTRVVEVSAPGHHPECDALLTTVPGLALAVTTADCMALLFSAPGAVAAAHAGWRGTELGMPQAALAALLARTGCAPSDITVHIGPCIRGCCYEVGEEVASRFPAATLRRVAGRARLDLPTAATISLRASGIPAHAIHDTGACTACESHWYYSYRRDTGATGRMWGVAVLGSTGT